ncbi:MAG: alpha/beta fold hydrolase [Acidobacteria bacterium]|nr:alpha/beta fold hydrolase [Acidobacteriota bacterium]NIM61628.1 alpha/beta fold hydrolase [Acidobacteriota bacterium]NIO58892.1 alpha/beta fold hydrolase [Acidobacteriota bacterium]NIQ29943.1 alpha/beta fold hydrolase [Acidobacteriota bacterium]NIQ87436.1 alpha/beta fold hydrolase [Acidobacteriota bacterium]
MKRSLVLVLAAWFVLLAASHLIRATRSEPRPLVEPPDHVLDIAAVYADGERGHPLRLVYRDEGPRDAPAVLLLHGSPGSRFDFRAVVPRMRDRYRLIAPDLPGFGASSVWAPDYSIRSHATYCVELLQRLGVDRVHVVGFSMGGGVGLEIYRAAPERVASLTLLSAIGVQELELFGDYRVNHVVHGVQLAAIRFVEAGVPHFGLFDDLFFGRPYARNFYDTDQRPLRGILEGFEPPMLILHGDADPLVAPAAAYEHARIVPHAELVMLADDHFMVFRDGHEIVPRLHAFLEAVEDGRAPRRADAQADRIVRAAAAFEPRDVPAAHGFALVLLLVSIAMATLVSEDLTCIVVGLLAGQGRLPFVAGVVACCVGIFIGDMLLFAAGRWFGRPALAYAPLKWLIRPEQVDASSRWLNRRGPAVIAISRFVPGLRLPTYFAAGVLRTSAWRFGIYFALAVAVWTPLLVGISAVIGERALGYFEWLEQHLLAALLLLGVWILIMVRLIVPTFTWRGRRRLLGTWRRWTRWEFWPAWLFYPPVVLYVAWLGLRFRSPLLFTAANPAIEASGFISESKHAILRGLADSPGYVARHDLVPAGESFERRLARIDAFRETHGLDYPLVFKPDAGQRGSGVAIVRDEEQARAYLDDASFDLLVQEYVPGDEFGLFYVRRPGEPRGRIISITEKKLPIVVGDGFSTLRRLILSDPRAVAIADHYFRLLGDRREDTPAEGERVQLVELGTHCRGAIFLDGARLNTPALTERIDRISAGFDGFYFGRYDVRTEDPEAFAAGERFKILELNGVTSEATHIYDPRHTLFAAWRTLFAQWRLAFEIGRANRASGHSPVGPADLLRLLRDYRKSSRTHPR